MVEILQDFEPFFGHSKTNITETGAFHYLRKLGVIDIGSNSVRMVIFDGNTKHTGATHTEGDRFRFVLNINFS